MKKFLLATAVVLGLAIPALSASQWIASYCGMGDCSWTRITAVDKVQMNERGMLLRVQEQTCHKNYPNGRSYPKTYACRPNEIEVTYEAVYCSAQSPRFAYHRQNDNKWVIQHLSFDEQHNYHAIQWDNRLYFLVCHNYDIGDGGYNLDQIAKRFGYHPIDTPDDTEVDSIAEVAVVASAPSDQFANNSKSRKSSPPHMRDTELGIPINFAKGESCWEYINKVHGYGTFTFYGDFLASQRIIANGILSSPSRFKVPVSFHLKPDMYVNGPKGAAGDFAKQGTILPGTDQLDEFYYTGSTGQYLFSVDWLDPEEQTTIIFQVCAYPKD
jgi:hypothetical protein